MLRATGARAVRAGYAVALDTLVIRPRGYAAMLSRPPRASRSRGRVMERHGLSWGGRRPTVPDGMHFDFHGDA